MAPQKEEVDFERFFRPCLESSIDRERDGFGMSGMNGPRFLARRGRKPTRPQLIEVGKGEDSSST